MNNTVELIGTYGGDESHALSAWTSTSRDLTDEKRGRIDKLLKFLAENGHHTPFEKSTLHFLVTADTASHIHIVKHRIGVCLSGDSMIYTETMPSVPSKGRPDRTIRKRRLSDLYDRWHNGVKDSAHARAGRKNGLVEKVSERVRLLPQCRNQSVRVLNEDTGEFVLARITDIWQSGEREVFAVTTQSGEKVKCSKDHRIFTKRGWVKTKDLIVGVDEIAISGGKINLNKSEVSGDIRAAIGRWTTKQRERLILPNDFCYVCGVTFLREELELDHVVPVSENLALGLDESNLSPICSQCHKKKSGAEVNNTERRMTAGAKYSALASVVSVGTEMTYDLSVEGKWKGFVADGIVVHNSVNGESARYKEHTEDKYYIPDDWPGVLRDMMDKHSKDSFGRYHEVLRMLVEAGVDRKRAKESARFFLPYNSQVTLDVSFNFRSFMHFQGLRNKPDAQKEIRDIAGSMLELVRETGQFDLSLEAFGY